MIRRAKQEERHRVLDDDEIIARIRDVRKVGPPISLRLKVAWATRFPHGEFVGDRAAGARLSVKAARTGGVVALVVLLGFLLFTGFTVAARDSRPGDALYVFKRWGEDIELAFTAGEAHKGEKNINLAERRLSELNSLVEAEGVTVENVRYIGSQYSANRQRVNEVVASIASSNQVDAARLKARMSSIETQKDNILSKLDGRFGASGLLVPASSVPVTLKDVTGKPSIDRKTSLATKTDEDGRLTFEYSGEPSDLGDVEITAESNGRKTTAVLLRNRASVTDRSGRYRLSVNPQPASVRVNQPVSIALSVAAVDGSHISAPVFYVEDRTSTSLIDGRAGIVKVQPNATGSASFVLTKTAPSVSRISVTTSSPYADFGEALVTGATVCPPSTTKSAGVRSDVTAGRITLDNGLVKVTASNRPGCVLDYFGTSGGAAAAGPLTDGIADPAPVSQVATRGPMIVSQTTGGVTYSISHEVIVDGSAASVEYRVTLKKGCRFVSIERSCVTDGAGGTVPAGMRAARMPRPPELRLGSYTAPDPEVASDFQFDTARPYATFNAGGGQAALAFPQVQPETWRIGPGEFGYRFGEVASVSSAVLGYVDGSVDKLISEAGDSAAFAGTATRTKGEGFEFRASAKPADRGKGSVIEVDVLKEYATSDLYF